MKYLYLVLILCESTSPDALATLARAERARRLAIRTAERPAQVYTNADLVSHRSTSTSSPVSPGKKPRPRRASSRDLVAEERHWRKEKIAHERDLARIDARISRLRTRLSTSSLPGSRGLSPRDRAQRALLEEALDALLADRARLHSRFLERARKGGAFPGWLR